MDGMPINQVGQSGDAIVDYTFVMTMTPSNQEGTAAAARHGARSHAGALERRMHAGDVERRADRIRNEINYLVWVAGA